MKILFINLITAALPSSGNNNYIKIRKDKHLEKQH